MTSGSESESPRFRPWQEYRRYPLEEMQARARNFADDVHGRRTIRAFSGEPVPESIIADCIRAAAEVEERAFYEQREPKAWLDDLAPLGTDADKPFLETAPWLIVVAGFPAADATVPLIERKSLDTITSWWRD